MTEKTKEPTLSLTVKYKDLEQKFSGSAEAIFLAINKYFSQFLPSFEIARKLMLKIDLENLAEQCTGLVAFSAEGPNILVPKGKLTDNETISVWLLASHLGQKLGVVENDALSKDELQDKLGKSGKITSTRLGELTKNGWVVKVNDENFRLTTFGVSQIQKDVLPRIQAKANL